MNRLRFFLVIFAIYVTTAHADFDSKYRVAVPESIQSIVSAEQLREYLNSDTHTNRIAACIRLGEIKGEGAFELLRYTFNKEPFREGMELPDGVKLYALIGIGKSGVTGAEEFLKRIASDYSQQISSARSHKISADSLSVIRGALEGLYEIASTTATAYLDSVFNEDNYYWEIRYFAYLNIVKLNLKLGSFSNENDTVLYLIDNLARFGPGSIMWNEDKSINSSFVKSAAYRQMLFKYKDICLRLLPSYISGLPIGDPAIPYLDSLRINMEGKPLH